jgi:hypothetical protein
MNENQKQLQRRVEQAAEATLARKKSVSAIDVLVGIRWLPPPVLDQWRQGRLPSLERGIEVNLHKLSTAMHLFRSWAVGRGLVPSETAYVTSTRQRQPLQFSVSGQESVERGYRTHWVSPDLSEPRRKQLVERQSKPSDLVAIMPLNDWTCTQCGGTGDLLLMEEPGPVCLACADMDHLVFLPAGSATLSRRAKKASRLSLVVVRFARARKRYERKGILVEEAALEQAERDCLADEDARARQRVRAAERREVEDVDFQAQFALAILDRFPTARRSGPRRSPGTRAPGAAAGWAAPPPRGRWTRRRSRSRSWRPCGTRTRRTTSC